MLEREDYERTSSSNRPVAESTGKLWTCAKCTFAANPDWSKACDVCSWKRDTSSGGNNPNEEPDDEDIKIYDTTLDRNLYDYARIWTCKRCTYINFAKDKRCELCNASRNSKSSSKHSSSRDSNNNNKQQQQQQSVLTDKWLCKACTYFNDTSTTKCLSCNAPREMSSEASRSSDASKQSGRAGPSGSRHSKEWVCEICSHRNRANTSVCELCENNEDNLVNTNNNNNNQEPTSSATRSLSLVDSSDYFNATMNPSLTYRSQKAMSTLKVS